jgi:hypothetical protein
MCAISIGSHPNVLKEPPPHNHPPDDVSLARRQLLSEMIDSVTADPCAPVRSSYERVLSSTTMPGQYAPTYASVESILSRRRRAAFPSVPSTIDEVVIEGEWSRTWSDKPFLQHLDNNWGIALFASKRCLRLLGDCDTVFVDGTFKTAPHPYYQLVTIHCLYNDTVLPVCFCLSTGKSTGHYRQIFRHLVNKVNALRSRQWAPTTLVCDFEMSLITAAETEFTGIHVRCCYFHFKQSLWRKVSALGLVTAYRGRSRRCRLLRKAIQMLMAIGFLPMAHVQRAFNTFCSSRRMIRLQTHFPRLTMFIQYMY